MGTSYNIQQFDGRTIFFFNILDFFHDAVP